MELPGVGYQIFLTRGSITYNQDLSHVEEETPPGPGRHVSPSLKDPGSHHITFFWTDTITQPGHLEIKEQSAQVGPSK